MQIKFKDGSKKVLINGVLQFSNKRVNIYERIDNQLHFKDS